MSLSNESPGPRRFCKKVTMLAPTVNVDQSTRNVWDIAVVGAGPAGAVAARQLALDGASVLLVDKATFPRPKVCGSCLNVRALAALARIGLGQLVVRHGGVPLERMCFAAGGRCALIRLPGGAALSRETLDTALAGEAIRAGAAFLCGTRAGLGRSTSGWRELRLEQNRRCGIARARLVLAADGLAGGLLSGQAGSPPSIQGGSRIGAGVTAPGPGGNYPPGVIFMASGPGGYVGLVRLEDGQLDVAAALDPMFAKRAGGLGQAAQTILDRAGLPKVPGLPSLAWRGTPALTRRAPRLAAERVLVLGDAAGYIEPFTGEGMAWAIASAVAIVPVALRAARQWDRTIPAQWARIHRKIVDRRQTPCRWMSRVLRYPTLTNVLVLLLSHAPGLANGMVRTINSP
jgi:flavin-dependent dehydrogenase